MNAMCSVCLRTKTIVSEDWIRNHSSRKQMRIQLCAQCLKPYLKERTKPKRVSKRGARKK